MRCGIGSLGGPVSENGRLCQEDGGHDGGARHQSVLMFPMLLPAFDLLKCWIVTY